MDPVGQKQAPWPRGADAIAHATLDMITTVWWVRDDHVVLRRAAGTDHLVKILVDVVDVTKAQRGEVPDDSAAAIVRIPNAQAACRLHHPARVVLGTSSNKTGHLHQYRNEMSIRGSICLAVVIWVRLERKWPIGWHKSRCALAAIHCSVRRAYLPIGDPWTLYPPNVLLERGCFLVASTIVGWGCSTASPSFLRLAQHGPAQPLLRLLAFHIHRSIWAWRPARIHMRARR
mmetsp:Transcript_84242/g.235058  ORF Transcript_84242/g.235058 Transcript_84242/m.235058 type:complete len:231 (-) Transcript_84242:31-723(-)